MIDHTTTDSNILIYSFDPTDQHKHKASIAIMAAMMAAHAVLPMQCLIEFYSVTTRKKYLTPGGAALVANDLIETLTVVAAELPDFVHAMELQRIHGVQAFDAMLLATSLRAGCKIFLSEDMQHQRTFGGMTVINPFKLSLEELGQLLT